MMTTDPVPQPDKLAEQRLALNSVLASSIFKKSPGIARLLQYICEKYFCGDTENVKEYSIAVDVFHRPESFDPANDSIVRVEIYRLRKKLREFYTGEGAHQTLEIVIATGQYIPEFISRPAPASPSETAEASQDGFPLLESIFGDIQSAGKPAKQPLPYKVLLAASALVALLYLVLVGLVVFNHSRRLHTENIPPRAPSASDSSTANTDVRIRCGYTKSMFRDAQGNIWSGDRYFLGGAPTEVPNQHITGTRDSQLYLTYRAGTFSYKIPLKPGTYEMRLYFSETTYGPTTTLGGGENSRVFNVQRNGQPLLTLFDIASDAGVNTADIRVFKDIHPGPDGYLKLDFTGSLGLPMINAIEIVPGTPHRLHTIRMVAQNNFFVDSAGNLWSPDSYFSGGHLAADKTAVSETSDPGLYAGERYGNFSYAIPAYPGKYSLTLYFSEKYWGLITSKGSGAGNRVFDVFCNGTALIRNLDIAKEVGPGRALLKTFHGLQPNAQGKLIVSFIPDQNYALVAGGCS